MSLSTCLLVPRSYELHEGGNQRRYLPSPLHIAAELGRGGWEALNKIAALTAITGREVEL